MKNVAISQRFMLAAIFFLLAFTAGCQEESQNGSSQPAASDPAASRPAVEPAANQGAPVPDGGKLEILMLGPSGTLKKLSQVVAMFNQPMVALGDYENVPEGAMKIEPALEGDFRWINQYSLAFIPKEPIEGSTEVKVTVSAGLAALSGAVLEEGKEIEIVLPRLGINTSYQLNNGALDEDLALKPSWFINFNQKPDMDSLKEKTFFLFNEGGQERQIAVDIKDLSESNRYREGYSFSITATEKLPKNTNYQLVMDEGIKSLSGPLPSTRIVAQTGSTFGPLTAKLDSMGSASENKIDPSNGIYLYFSNPVKMSEAAKLISIDNGYDMSVIRSNDETAESEVPAASGQNGQEEEDVSDYGTYLYIPGGFKPETQYTITFNEALTDVYGQRLGQNLEQKFLTGQYSTFVRLDENYGLLETETEPKVPVVLSNIEGAEVEGFALNAEQAVRFMGRTEFTPSYYYYNNINKGDDVLKNIKPVKRSLIAPEGGKNGPTIVPLDLNEMFGDNAKGRLLYIRSFYKDNDNPPQTIGTYALVQISDIGLAVKVGPESGLIWVTNLASGEAWPKAALAVRAPDGTVLWKGSSDENGLAALPGTEKLLEKVEGADSFFIVAQAEGQMSVWNINWTEGLEPWRWNMNYAPALSRSTESAHWLLNALPLYKPGETAEFKLIARENRGDQLADLADQELKIQIQDGRGQMVEEVTVTTDSFGTVSHKLQIPADAALGYWNVNVGRPNTENFDYAGNFMVMTYRAPAFQIEVEGLPEKALAGGKAEVEVQADYHFGAPVSDQPIEYSFMSAPAYGFSLPGLSEYNFVNLFSDADEYDESGFGYQEPTTQVASDEVNLDDQGHLKIDLSLEPAPGQKPAPRIYTGYFTVTDVDQRRVSNTVNFLVHPAEIYVGLTADSYLAESGQPYTVKAIAADLNGELVEDCKITATLYRRVWQNVRRRAPGSGYEYVSRVVDEEVAKLEAASGKLPAELTFSPEKAGFYWVLAEAEDRQGRKNQSSWSFYMPGRDPVGWHMTNDDHLSLVTDKKQYKPGDVARIMVQSPFAEGYGLLTIERAGIREARTFTIENHTPTLEVPINEDDAPNIYVSILLTRGRIADKPDENGVDLGKPAIRLGYTELKIPTTRDLLTVEVTPGLKEVGPGDEVEVAIAVKDNQGNPFSEAELAVIAADAAVLQLSGEENYYPNRQFHSDQPLRIITADNLISLIGRRNWSLKGANPGGGGAELASAMSRGAADSDVRRMFAALAYFNPAVKLDGQGRATLKIKMPENLTTFKIYGVATGHGRKSGTGSSSVLVTRDLLTRSALPGYAGVGDEFSATMVVSNRSENSGEATVSLAGQNFTLLEGEPAEKTVSIGPGENREVSFKVRAGDAAEAKFLFRVTMGEDTDAAEFVIPVVPPNKLTTQASYEQLLPGEKRTDLYLPQGLDTTRGLLELELSPTLLGVMSEPFEWLFDYPHGCIEQTTSRAWASLIWLELKDRMPDGQSEEKQKKARNIVLDQLQLLPQWEYGGGYPLWPGDYDWRGRSVYLTSYILEFVLSARDAGFDLPYADYPKRIGIFLNEALRGDAKWPTWYSEEAKRESRSYALAALSRAGENVASYIEVFYQQRDKLNLVELINLIRAVSYQPKGSGQAGQLRELLALLPRHINVTAGEIQFVNNNPGAPEIWATPVRNTAMILETLSRVAPHNNLVPSLVRYLVNQSKSGQYGTTQNNLAVLSALAAYAKALEPENPNLTIEAILGDLELARAEFKAFTDPPVNGSLPARDIPTEAPAVIYTLEGEGQAWAALKLKTAPIEPDLSADTSGGFMLSRAFTIVRPENGGTGIENFRRGDVVRVTVTMMVPAPRHSVVLEDRVPAGFEPINFNLSDADMSLVGMVTGAEQDSYRTRYWYNHQEIWPDRVAVYANYLSPGVYTYSYLARVVTPGTYITPGPQAEEMYAPETYGRGQGQTLVVE